MISIVFEIRQAIFFTTVCRPLCIEEYSTVDILVVINSTMCIHDLLYPLHHCTPLSVAKLCTGKVCSGSQCISSRPVMSVHSSCLAQCCSSNRHLKKVTLLDLEMLSKLNSIYFQDNLLHDYRRFTFKY